MNTERFRLRTFLRELAAGELETRAGRTDLIDVAPALEGNPKAVLFEDAGASGPLAGNVNASRARLAAALGVAPAQALGEVMRRLQNRGEIVELARPQAPVQDVVMTGDAADLTTLPINLQHAEDGAPYISASIDYTIDPATGWTNVGIRRLMLRGRRVCGMDVNAPSDLRAIYEAAVRRGERLPIAFTVGAHPIDFIAAMMRIPTDEIALNAKLRGAPLPVVKCITNDIRVPADAEFVIEGYMDSAGYVEPEGPYGEFLGYYGEVKRNPLFHVTAITRRKDAIFQTATISGRTLACTDTAQLNALRAEVTIWRALESAVREVVAVYAVPSGGGAFNARVAIRQRVPGEAGNAIAAVLGCLANVKHVFVTDPDIDIFDDRQMDWALATRFQADRDLVVQTGMRAMPLDPSLGGVRTWAKAGFDLTLPVLRPGETRAIQHRVPEPLVVGTAGATRTGTTLAAALAGGPKFFGELLQALGSRDGRELVLALDALREAGRLERDSEGRYFAPAK